MRKNFISFTIAVLLGVLPVLAQQASFQQYNPDVDKYVFTSSFITSLSYFNRVALRLKGEAQLKVGTSTDEKMIKSFMDDRTLDNTELRIARNYLTRYAKSRNALIGKVASRAIEAYDKVLAISVKEKELWQEFHSYKLAGKPKDFDEERFVRQQVFQASEKKAAAKGLIEASALIRPVLLSAALCENDACMSLAITQVERDKLNSKLDSFARASMDWGMKEGQSTIEACVALIREVLEDKIYISK
ncbi:MAG: hypothetical protein HQL18_01995 [Candidatus Omnitrophica bacterium]|nr:hypothetical protein [Candidatus Omnitrophota bacterium]